MYITGLDITDFQFRTNPDFKINTQLDMEWYQTSAGNWHAVDRGASADYYETTITTFGTEAYINNIINQLNTTRLAKAATITMYDFADNEHVFGEDILYTPDITGLITEYDVRKQNSWKGFKLSLTLRALNPEFTGVASLPDFTSGVCTQIGYTADSSWTYNNYDSYYSNFSHYDHRDDQGLFKGSFNLTQTELRNLRTWMRVNRDTSFTLSGIYGVAYPFGPREGTGPWTAKIVELEEKNKFGLDRWIVNLKIARNY
jgi:hypothetical protein